MPAFTKTEPATPEERPDVVFISHSSDDQSEAEAIVALLEARGVPCWITPRDVPAGASWPVAIADAIGRCCRMLLVFSRNADESHAVLSELAMADKQSKIILPVRISKYEPVKTNFFVARFQRFDMFANPLDSYGDTLAAAIRGDPVPGGSSKPRIRGIRGHLIGTLPLVVAAIVMTLLVQIFFSTNDAPALYGAAWLPVFAVCASIAWVARHLWRTSRRGKEHP